MTFDSIYVGGRVFTAGWDASRPLGVGVREGWVPQRRVPMRTSALPTIDPGVHR